MAKFDKTGLLDHVNKFQGNYGDAMGVQDYHSSLNQVLAAQEAFHTLPAKIRSKFFNDPGQFMAYMDNPKNAEELQNLLNDATGAGEPPTTSGADDPGTPIDQLVNATPEATPDAPAAE